MLESDVGQPIVTEAPPVVDGPPSKENEGAGSTQGVKLPGWTGQLTKEQMTDIQRRVAEDPKAVDQLPKGLSELYSSYTTLKAQSVGAIKRPAPEASKEEWDQFYKGLGRPETSDGYALKKPDVPSGMRYNDSVEKWFRDTAYAMGLTQEQAQKFYDEESNRQVEAFTKAKDDRKAAATKALDALRQEWQDKFEDNMAGVKASFLQFIPEGQNGALFKKIQAYGLDNDPDFLKMFRSIYEKIGPPRMVVPSGQGSGSDREISFRLGSGLPGRS